MVKLGPGFRNTNVIWMHYCRLQVQKAMTNGKKCCINIIHRYSYEKYLIIDFTFFGTKIVFTVRYTRQITAPSLFLPYLFSLIFQSKYIVCMHSTVDIESFWPEGYVGQTPNSGHELAMTIVKLCWHNFTQSACFLWFIICI